MLQAIGQGKELNELTVDELKAFYPDIDDSVAEALTIEATLNSKSVYGGTSPPTASPRLLPPHTNTSMTKAELIEACGRNELVEFLGIKIEIAEADRVVLTMPVTSKVHQYLGIMNGGVSMYLAETAASIGAVASTDLTKFAPVGLEINGNHLRAVSKGTLTVEATPIYPGRTVNVWQINITNEKDKLVFTGRITILIQKKPAVSQKRERSASIPVKDYRHLGAPSLRVGFPPFLG